MRGNSIDRPAQVGAPPTISVIVPSYNAAHYLAESLPPLIRMRDRGDLLEVIVVDDCSPDPTNVAEINRHGAALLRMAKNGGPGAGRNFAARSAQGDILWFVDADVVAHESGAHVIASAFATPGVTAVFGSYDDAPPARNFASQYKNLIHRYYHQRGRTDSSSFWSGCGAVRKSAFIAVGGFDGARYGRPMIEDIDLGYRLKDSGGSIRLMHDLQCTHLKKWTLPEVVRTDIFQRAVPWSNLILAHRGMSDDLNVSPAERVKAFFAGLLVATLALALVPPLWPTTPLLASALAAAVAALNAPLFRFFARNRGVLFAMQAVGFHQVYYVYSAVTFVLCAVAHRLSRGDPKANARAGSADRTTA